MTPTEYIAKFASTPTAGLFVPLRALLRAPGTGAGGRAPIPTQGSIGPRVCRLALGSLASLLALLALSTTAQATITHAFLPEPSKTLSEGVPAGCGAAVPEPPCVKGPLGGVNAMTVDSHHLWLAERTAGGSRVDRFSSSTGEFLVPQARRGKRSELP